MKTVEERLELLEKQVLELKGSKMAWRVATGIFCLVAIALFGIAASPAPQSVSDSISTRKLSIVDADNRAVAVFESPKKDKVTLIFHGSPDADNLLFTASPEGAHIELRGPSGSGMIATEKDLLTFRLGSLKKGNLSQCEMSADDNGGSLSLINKLGSSVFSSSCNKEGNSSLLISDKEGAGTGFSVIFIDGKPKAIISQKMLPIWSAP